MKYFRMDRLLEITNICGGKHVWSILGITNHNHNSQKRTITKKKKKIHKREHVGARKKQLLN